MRYYMVVGSNGPALLHNHQPCQDGCEQAGELYEHRFACLADLGKYIDGRIFAKKGRVCEDTFGPSEGNLPPGYRDLTLDERMEADTTFGRIMREQRARKLDAERLALFRPKNTAY
jgi:hypothetical protein